MKVYQIYQTGAYSHQGVLVVAQNLATAEKVYKAKYQYTEILKIEMLGSCLMEVKHVS